MELKLFPCFLPNCLRAVLSESGILLDPSPSGHTDFVRWQAEPGFGHQIARQLFLLVVMCYQPAIATTKTTISSREEERQASRNRNSPSSAAPLPPLHTI